MSDPTRTVRPPASTISIVPGLTSVLAGADGDDSVTGTKLVAGALVGLTASRAGIPIADPSSRRQRNSTFACSPCRRATSDNVAPPTSISATIAFFCSALQLRRFRAPTSPRGLVLTPDIMQSPSPVRINRSETRPLLSPAQGGHHQTLTA
jgi:hypothetical protein